MTKKSPAGFTDGDRESRDRIKEERPPPEPAACPRASPSLTFPTDPGGRLILPPSGARTLTRARQERGTHRQHRLFRPPEQARGEAAANAAGHLQPEPDSSPRRRRRGIRHAREG
ncbi:hypothetical protein GCM10010510_22070 [Streptomyces anandii JCM 4720]|nr:hypothetical protein GCM10010510_22070 [Streptomyces anandii JCM 4720]